MDESERLRAAERRLFKLEMEDHSVPSFVWIGAALGIAAYILLVYCIWTDRLQIHG